MVIVQPHLLRDKSTLRLRPINFDGASKAFNTGGNDEFVKLEMVAPIIKKRIASTTHKDDKLVEGELNNHSIVMSNSLEHETSSATNSKVQCIYVESDQFYGKENINSIEDKGDKKNIWKAMNASLLRATSFITNISDESSPTGFPIVAVRVPFLILRDYGTQLMINGSFNIKGTNIHEKFPEYKKILKTLAMAIDSLIRQRISDKSKPNSKSMSAEGEENSEFFVLLLSTVDDKFDLLSLGGSKLTQLDSHGNGANVSSARLNKRERGRRRQ